MTETTPPASHPNTNINTNTNAINLSSQLTSIPNLWSPVHVLTTNSTHSFKLARIQGEFIWHSHPDTDEVFYCVSGGPFVIEIATNQHERYGFRSVTLKVGDIFNVPRGVRHRPVAEVETGILLVEKVGTVNTGDEAGVGEGKERMVLVDEGV